MSKLIIFKFFLLALSNLSAFSAAINGESLYLCDETHLETEYTALDQCTRWGTAQLRHNSFALRFQLYGKCENGMLICYPGSLDPSGANSAYGMSPEIHFQVQNHANNKVGDQCLEYQRKCSAANHCNARRIWHGIRVSAPKALGGTQIELSISKEKYNLGNIKQFNIEFGNARNLMTKVTDELGRELGVGNDNLIIEAYLSHKIKKDAKLGNYAALWMLGLDFLPMNNQNSLQLHVFRDCGCEMHAWFVHPSDEVPPLRSEPPMVSADCPTNVRQTAEQFALPVPALVGRTIHLRQRLNKKPEDIELRFGNNMEKHLLVLHVDNPPYGLINISSTLGGLFEEDGKDGAAEIKKQKFTMNSDVVGRQFKTFGSEERSAEETNEWVDKYLDVTLAVHNYYYEVKVGDRQAVTYFPKSPEWWTEDKMDNITRIEVAGDVYPSSIEEPKVKQRLKNDQPKRQSYSKRFEEALDIGDTVVIRGKVVKSAIAGEELDISFLLMHNSPAFNRYVSKVAWFLFQKSDNLTMGHFFEEKFHVQKSELNVFKPNEPFEMRLKMVQQTKSDVAMLNITLCTPSGTGATIFNLMSMNFRDINFLNVVGTIELFEAPFVILPDDFVMRKKRGYHIFPLLVPGDFFQLEGKLREDASVLKIELLHDSPVSNPYFGNVVLQLIFKIDQGQMFLSTFTNKLIFDNPDLMKSFPSKIFAGEEFKIEIRVEFEEYKIFVYGALVATFEHVLPPWAVNFINFNGNFSNISNFVLDRTKSIFCAQKLRSLALPFVMEIPDQKMLQFGDSITIQGTVTKQNPEIVIFLLNEAVESYNSVSRNVIDHLVNGTFAMIGTIVTRAVLANDLEGKSYIEFSYNDYVEMHNLSKPLTKAQNFQLKIVMQIRPMFDLGGYGKFVFKSDTMPVWAIQYIRVQGDLELSKMPHIEFGQKKGRHK